MTEETTLLRPGEFSRLLLKAIDASEGRRKRRKRDTTPDRIGLDIKRGLLLRAAAENPAPETFEAWLLDQALAVPASGPVRALCAEILHEYRVAAHDPDFRSWLLEGAPSADADADAGGCDLHPPGQCPGPVADSGHQAVTS